MSQPREQLSNLPVSEFTRRMERVIPGGAHTYSKGRDQFPVNAPSGIVRGEGCYVWGNDGQRYLDWGMGLSSVSIGHGDRDVVAAVQAAIADGVNFMRPATLELEAAEFFVDAFGGDMVKFAKHGSSVTTAAVKLARAFTGRSKVAVAREHPFFSFDDWFIVSTEADWGIPEALRQLTVTFSYNDVDSLDAVFRAHPGEIACVILEPVKFDEPAAGFLQKVRDLCSRYGAVLIFDEMISGLKWAMPGAGTYFGVTPDLSTWGKGISNGFSCTALSGRRDIMTLGGIEEEGRRKLFLLSTTHGAESSGLAAMMATVKKFRDNDLVAKNWRTGRSLIDKLNARFHSVGISKNLQVVGYPCLPFLRTLGPDGTENLNFRTLFMQEVIKRGVLFQAMFVVTSSHDEAEIDRTIEVFAEAAGIYAKALAHGSVDGFLNGPAIKPVFRRTV